MRTVFTTEELSHDNAAGLAGSVGACGTYRSSGFVVV